MPKHLLRISINNQLQYFIFSYEYAAAFLPQSSAVEYTGISEDVILDNIAEIEEITREEAREKYNILSMYDLTHPLNKEKLINCIIDDEGQELYFETFVERLIID